MIFLLNLFCNSMILLLTKLLVRTDTRWYRILIGTIFASLLVPFTIFFPDTLLTKPFGKLLYSILIVLCTFGFHSFHSLGKRLFVFYFVSFAIGGGLFGIHFLLNSSLSNIDIVYPNNIYGNEISLLFLLIGFPLICLFTKNRMDKHVKDKVNFDQIYQVIIEFNGQSYQTKGFVDSGNHLVDPLTNRPVAICDEKFIQSFFEKKEWDQLKNALERNKLEHIPTSVKDLMYVVPYKGVGGKSSYLYEIGRAHV